MVRDVQMERDEEEQSSTWQPRSESRLSLIRDAVGDNYIAYEVLDEVAEPSEHSENLADYKTRWRTIRVLYLTLFINSLGFSIVMSSLWPFLQKVDPTSSPTFLGWVVAAYGLAQLVGSFAFGFWCQYRPSKEPLIAGIVILMIGSGLYAFVQAFSNGGYIILIARTVLGFSGGKAAVAKAVVSQSTTILERTSAMANLALFQSAGLMFGPAMQAACVPIGDEGISDKSLKLYLNIYNTPGYIGMIMGLINILFIVFFYKERKVETAGSQLMPVAEDKVNAETPQKPDPWAIVLVSILYFVTISTFTLNETIMTPLMMDEFNWKREEAVLHGGILMMVAGFLALLSFIAVKPLSKRFTERKILALILVMILVGMFLYLPWGNTYPHLKTIKVPNNGSTPITKSTQVTGCPSTYGWCKSTPQLNLPQYLIGAMLVLSGFPVAALLLNTTYSKILGPRRQGIYMGWITAVGSLARGVGPVVVTIAYVHGGPRWTFLGWNIIIVLALVALGILFDKLVPFHEYISKI